MKKILILMLLFAPLFAAAQGKVYNKNNQLVYKYDGSQITKQNKETKAWEVIMTYQNGKVYTRNNKPDKTFEDKLMYIVDGGELFIPENPASPIVSFDNRFVYMGKLGDMNSIIGCIEDNSYYRGTMAKPEKLVFTIEGKVPIELLLFLNMAK